MNHTCHAHGCSTAVPPKMFMCKRHWSNLPKKLQRAIWREYRPGQERDKNPSARYMAVQQLALMATVTAHDDVTTAANYRADAQVFREMAIDAGLGDPLDGLLPQEAK